MPGWIHFVLVEVEKQFNHTQKASVKLNDVFEYSIWEEQKYADMAGERKEEEEVCDFGSVVFRLYYIQDNVRLYSYFFLWKCS